MTEKGMEDLIWSYPEKFLNEPLKPFSRQQRSAVGRSDLVFVDGLDRFLVIELRKDKLSREAIGQIMDYFGVMKRLHPSRPVELLVIANNIPEERRLAWERQDILCMEIPGKKCGDIAAHVGYMFASEQQTTRRPENEEYASTVRSRSTTQPAAQVTYTLRPDFDRPQLSTLIEEFSRVVRRGIDQSLAAKLKKEFLHDGAVSPRRETVYQLSKSCKTTNPLCFDGMKAARKISNLLFGVVVDRDAFERRQ